MKRSKQVKTVIAAGVFFAMIGLLSGIGQAGMIIPLSDNDTDDIDPKVFGKNVVWQWADPNGDWEIRFYDGNDIIDLTDNDTDDIEPDIFRTGVVWQGWDPNGDWEIFYFDGETVSQLTNNDVNDIKAKISKDLIVWQSYDGSDWEIMMMKIPHPAELKVAPQALNLKSKGRWITCLLTLPEGYTGNNVVVSSLLRQGTVPVDKAAAGKSSNQLVLKFDRSAVQALLNVGDAVKITLTGQLNDGTEIKASDTIKVINPGGKP